MKIKGIALLLFAVLITLVSVSLNIFVAVIPIVSVVIGIIGLVMVFVFDDTTSAAIKSTKTEEE